MRKICELRHYFDIDSKCKQNHHQQKNKGNKNPKHDKVRSQIHNK